MLATQAHISQVLRQTVSADLAAAIQTAKESAARLGRRVGRFEIYDLLKAVYRVYLSWKHRKIAKRSARRLARELCIAQRKGMSPIRVLIEATMPDADFKQKSRWVRALQYVHSEKVPPSQFHKLLRTRGGVAGCARLAAGASRKRKRSGGDWID